MRLINADDILEKAHDVTLEGGAKHRCFDTTRLHEIPTVEAIPIGFIKQKINLEKSFAEATYATVYWKELIALWDVQKGKYHE